MNVKALVTFNQSESAASIDLAAACLCVNGSGMSAIDEYYAVRTHVLAWLFKPPFDSDQDLRRVLVVSLFSAAEAYLRSVLARVLAVCPVAAELAATQNVPFGAVGVFTASDLSMAISDQKGFTSVGEIASRTKSFTGLTIEGQSSLGTAVREFEQLCHVRHAIVHQSGELSFSNRRVLGVRKSGRIVLRLSDQLCQGIVQRVDNLVRAYNQFVGSRTLTRWFVDGVFQGKWSVDRALMERLLDALRSEVDGLPGERPFEVYDRVRKATKRA